VIETPASPLSGMLRFIRYGFMPNKLRYCGGDAREWRQHARQAASRRMALPATLLPGEADWPSIRYDDQRVLRLRTHRWPAFPRQGGRLDCARACLAPTPSWRGAVARTVSEREPEVADSTIGSAPGSLPSSDAAR
jgi:hypothetical protein